MTMNHINDVKRRKRSYEAHTADQTSHIYHGSLVTPSTPYQWHEMDYTSQSMGATCFAPTSAPVHYHGNGMMSFSPVDFTGHDLSYATTYAEHDRPISAQSSGLYRVGPFGYTDLANIDGDAASLSQESIYSRSTRLHSLTDSERRDSQPNSILSSTDVQRESEGFDRIFPLTPLESESCQSTTCGPEPHCHDLTNLSSIEECARLPCTTDSPHLAVPRPSSNPSGRKKQGSPNHTTHSGLSSPTTLTPQKSAASDTSKVLKPKRTPRSRSAHASIGDSSALEKASKLRARQAHSIVERKYRDNLNMKISQLHQTLQTARYGPDSASRSPQRELKSDYFDDETLLSPETLNGKSSTASTPTGAKVRKSDVLTEAMDYVNVAGLEMRNMSEEIDRLNARVQTLEKLIRCEDCNLLKQMVTLQVEGQQAGSKGRVGV